MKSMGFHKSDDYESKTFRIEIGGDMPNAKLITIIRLRDKCERKDVSPL